MISRLMQQAVTIQRRSSSGTNDHGAPTTATTSTTATTGYLEPLQAAEIDGRQITAVNDKRLFLPADTDIDTSDRVVVDGTTYEIVTVESHPRATTGSEHHLELAVRQVNP